MEGLFIIVQASTSSWGGGGDLCMNELKGKPAVWHTITRLVDEFRDNDITIAAPEFDIGGFDRILDEFKGHKVSVFYGFNDSPLKRIISITKHLPSDSIVLRVDGLNFCVDVKSVEVMLKIMNEKQLDLIKFQDDWPAICCADVYRVGTLRKMLTEISDKGGDVASYHIHPKYYLLSFPEKFICERYFPIGYSDKILRTYREQAKGVFNERDQGEGECHAISAGDTLSFHYKIALTHLKSSGRVLDIACGLGYGSALLANICTEVIGADIDPKAITMAADNYSALNNVRFVVADCQRLSFDDEYFDAVVSFETIEHVNAHSYLTEIRRVLKPNSTLILSTPQNAIGHIPVNPHHVLEYSLTGIKNLVSQYFIIDKVIGIKQGTIVFDNDSTGSNTVLFCHKSFSDA